MKVAIVAPSPVPFTRGGAERAWSGLQWAIDELTPHDAELVKIPIMEDNLPNLVAGYKAFSELEVTHFDLVITSKYPAWLVRHPHHVVWMFHPLRGLYDTYRVFGLPEFAAPTAPEIRELVKFLRREPRRAELDEFFARWDKVLDVEGPLHPELALPSPVARAVVHWLDGIALAPGEVERHTALSRTIALRPGYFPAGVEPAIAYAPSDLPSATARPAAAGRRPTIFTASRLDGPKRLDLLIKAMAHVPGDVTLEIGGTGPLADDLRALARRDARIRFLGFVPDAELAQRYADATVVPFLPADEDYGLIAVEAMGCGTPVVTCTDSGGPTELVVDGVSGRIVPPTPEALGAALAELVADPERAARMGATARRRAHEITWPRALATVLDEREATARVAPPIEEPEEPARSAGPRPAPTRLGAEPVTRRSLGASRSRRPKVVALTTFGIAEMRHGGQLRCHHLYGALAGHVDVEVVALVDLASDEGARTISPGLHQTAVVRSAAHHHSGTRISTEAGMLVTDIVAGTHIRETPAYLARLRDALRDASAVILAEPYLLPAVEAVGSALPRIYDAFNVEAELKAGSLPGSDIGRRLLDEVTDVERRAVRDSAAITTCSAEDAKRLSLAYGRALTDFTVVPNGTDCRVAVPSPEDRRRHSTAWRRRWAAHRPDHATSDALAVFFASWHPPNLDAAEILLWLATLLPEVQFVLGGSHGDAFIGRPRPDNLVFTGVLGERSKRTLLDAADVALNPMLQGSGTNLKVIEYLAAGAPVVSTGFGVRGLDVVDGEHLLVADPHAMPDAIRAVMADPDSATHRARAGRKLAMAEYDWQALGDRLAKVVRAVSR